MSASKIATTSESIFSCFPNSVGFTFSSLSKCFYRKIFSCSEIFFATLTVLSFDTARIIFLFFILRNSINYILQITFFIFCRDNYCFSVLLNITILNPKYRVGLIPIFRNDKVASNKPFTNVPNPRSLNVKFVLCRSLSNVQDHLLYFLFFYFEYRNILYLHP